jgi:hypothetical protein
MLDHKIDNRDNKESKTESSNKESSAMLFLEEGKLPSPYEHPQIPWTSDPLESYLQDYLRDKEKLMEEDQTSPLNSKVLIVEN